MNKTTKSNDTHNQLREIMQRHTATLGASTTVTETLSPPVTAPTAIKVAVSGVSVVPQSMPMVNSSRTKTAERCTTRLLMTEVARVNDIILETHQRTGKPITTSDVLRIGLRRVGGKAPITPEEIAALRATDARRKSTKTNDNPFSDSTCKLGA
jgi:hypothetical protein